MCSYNGPDGKGPVDFKKTRPRQWLSLPVSHSKVLYKARLALALQMCRSLSMRRFASFALSFRIISQHAWYPLHSLWAPGHGKLPDSWESLSKMPSGACCTA